MKVLFSRISDNRSKAFSVKTSIVSDGERRYAVKEAVFPEGEAHIVRVFQNQELLTRTFPNVNIAKTWLDGDRLFGEFIDGAPLSRYYETLVDAGDRQGIFDLFEWQVGLLTTEDNLCKFSLSEGFRDWFGGDGENFDGSPALSVCNFDATPENIFIVNDSFDKPYFIDYEWCFDFPVPICLLKYHIIDMIYPWLSNLHTLIPQYEFHRQYLQEAEIASCEDLWRNFISKVCNLQMGVMSDAIYDRYAQINQMADYAALKSETEKHKEVIDDLKKEKSQLIQQNKLNEDKLSEKESEILFLETEKDTLWIECQKIRNSKSWKVADFLRKTAYIPKKAIRKVKNVFIQFDTPAAPVEIQSEKNDDFRNYDLLQDIQLPLISIIVPNYNHEPYLRERLESIYNQTYTNIEVILLDDCSTDGSINILREYADRYSTITTLILNTENSGRISKQWEKGIELASGKYIWIAESDDYCELNFLQTLMEMLRFRSVMFAFAKTEFVKNGNQCWSVEEYLADLPEYEWEVPFVITANQAVQRGFARKNIIPNM
ncbi:MAG: glycosyltransferase family 2 protein, partial [Clostridiales Family XIII bacterium]|nr:glycosyltransferase family 2 protein [Clostridiales Family XIII bacterium]